jgi:thiamine transport system ATP-binding protein
VEAVLSITFDKLHLQVGNFSLSADFTIAKGRKVALLGPSGGGKSTLLSALAGFMEVSRGRILFNDREITGLPPAKRPVTLLFQDHNLFPHLSAEQNVGLGLDPNLRLNAAQKQLVAEA